MAAIKGIAFQQPQLRHLHMSVMEPNLPRPESALARGIKITEFSGARVNPEPVTFEESDILLEEYLSPRRLRELTGVDDLEKVHFLELKVDTSDTSLGNFGVNLPNLLQLKLSNSIIYSFRDLGSSLSNVRVLWMAQCGLVDLDSISSMSSLRELYLAYNDLTDISPCSMLDELRILDIEGNNLCEISQVEFLALCQNLTHLTLEGNPVCLTPYPDQAAANYNYRKALKTALPQLKYLDDQSLESDEDTRPSTSEPPMSGFEEDWKLLQELMEEGIVISADNNIDTTGRPATACRPTSAIRPYTSTGLRPWSSIKTASPTGRPGTGMSPGSRASKGRRPGSASTLGTTDDLGDVDEASVLTTGGVVCGNPSKALRARQQQMRSTSAPSDVTTSKIMLQLKKKAPTKTYDATKEQEEEIQDNHLVKLFEELKQWKAGHEKRVKEIEASKAPQVLTIGHDEDEGDEDEDATSSSSEEEEDSECSSNGASDGYEIFSRPTSRATAAELESCEDARPKIQPPGLPAPKHRRPVSMALHEDASPAMLLHHDESFESYDAASSPDGTPECPTVKSFGEREKMGPGRSWGISGEGARVSSPLASRPLNMPLRPVFIPGLPSRASFNSVANDIGRASPVIRSPRHSPEKRPSEAAAAAARSGPSTPIIGRVSQLRPLERVRQRDLANVPLLPSKYKTDS